MYTLSSRRQLTIILVVLSSVIILSTFIYSPSLRRFATYPILQSPSRSPLSGCSPEAYAEGHWALKSNISKLSRKEDVLAISGFEGCASSREITWHLGSSWSDEEAFKKLQWRGSASSYEWIPGERCQGYTRVEREDLVRQLVEEGGWLVLGDSISEGHFFSLSCLLYPHVRATPDYTLDPWYFDRAWPQNLYLNPSSPLLPQLNFPEGFEIDTTPLATFRRVDLLLGKSELDALHTKLHPPTSSDPPPSIFSDEGTWDLAPSAYLPIFLAPLPEANYRTMVISTAGHWTTTLFSGFHNDLRGLLEFFGEAMKVWVDEVVTSLELAKSKEKGSRAKERQVVVRAYVHGHESCHEEQVELAGPLNKYQGLVWNWYNWNWIRRFNDVFESIILQRTYPNIHFLPIDIPALLRPDGHTEGDCLHILTGSGIMEALTSVLHAFLKYWYDKTWLSREGWLFIWIPIEHYDLAA